MLKLNRRFQNTSFSEWKAIGPQTHTIILDPTRYSQDRNGLDQNIMFYARSGPLTITRNFIIGEVNHQSSSQAHPSQRNLN